MNHTYLQSSKLEKDMFGKLDLTKTTLDLDRS